MAATNTMATERLATGTEETGPREEMAEEAIEGMVVGIEGII